MSKSFHNSLYQWHSTIQRELPWKKDATAYHIWLSEIILQQTRVDQGLPYYLKFRDQYPSIFDLAAAPEEEIMKMWEGLGYYSRARNLHETAKFIVNSGGEFPRTYKELLKLKGVGPYTAAAIASFAYGEAVAVLDGNVKRVISRLFGIYTPSDTSKGKNELNQALYKIFDPAKPAFFNQAIMDFGALHCTPRNPKCKQCPFQENCYAFLHQEVQNLPAKRKRIIKKDRYLHYFLVQNQNKLVLKKRLAKDIWKHLYEPLLIEGQKDTKPNALSASLKDIIQLENYNIKLSEGPFKHVLSHQNLFILFHHIDCKSISFKKGSPYFLVERKNLGNFAFPRIIDWYLKEKSIYLNKYKA